MNKLPQDVIEEEADQQVAAISTRVADFMRLIEPFLSYLEKITLNNAKFEGEDVAKVKKIQKIIISYVEAFKKLEPKIHEKLLHNDLQQELVQFLQLEKEFSELLEGRNYTKSVEEIVLTTHSILSAINKSLEHLHGRISH